MQKSLSQQLTIDSLLATHRELVPCDLVDYEEAEMAMGGVVITIHTGEYWYSYKILKTGVIKYTRKSDNGISFKNLQYFN